MPSAFYVSNIIMHIVLMTVFLTIFFFTYGSYIERLVTKKQVIYIIDDLLGSEKILLPENLRKDIKKNIELHKKSIDKSKDQIVIKNNEKIRNLSIIISVSILVVGLFIILILTKKLHMQNMTQKIFWGKLLKHNIITLFFIALTELIFLSVFAQNYISVDVNNLKKGFIDKLFHIIQTKSKNTINTDNQNIELIRAIIENNIDNDNIKNIKNINKQGLKNYISNIDKQELKKFIYNNIDNKNLNEFDKIMIKNYIN